MKHLQCLNITLLILAWKFNTHSDSATSRKLFRFSLLYLPALMVLMLSSKKYLVNTQKHNDSVVSPNEVAKKSNFLAIFTPITSTSSV